MTGGFVKMSCSPRTPPGSPSPSARLHRLPLGRRGRLGEPETIELGGDWVRSGFTANGIARTPDGSGLLVTDGDAPALVGRTLHVVQPTPNRWTSSDRTGRNA
ncbi:hypothetical protein [Streptomyces akebiae]|uniref:Uncharacterized protein n=1 Tax=Streptomyces akebiae TaxID=2865673 RepID=A0ABX8Y1T2_9ACTN|nr:hypothetical protein [Streptomyces akebiae]QYX81792.1 hypothetical protein K1J60_39195 [Streptomyces akebiae]